MTISYPKKIDWSQLGPTDYPNQVVALDVPVVYDECSLHRYYLPVGATPYPLPPEFVPNQDPTMSPTVSPALTSNATGIQSFIIKNVELGAISASPYPEGKYRTIKADYTITIDVTIQRTGGAPELRTVTLNRSETRVMYCPAPPVQGTAIWAFDPASKDAKDSPIFRLMLNNIFLTVELSAASIATPTTTPILAVNLAYTALLKCEFAVQLLVPSYGFFIASKDCYPPVPIPTPTEKGFYPEINFDELIQP